MNKTSGSSQTDPARDPQRYDAVIVGGGIQGCGCAQALSALGFDVLLLEQNTLGSATSSQSSKLIHGGLRYLETAQFSLVRKSLNERAQLIKLAPDLVKLKPFYIPIYRGQRLSSWKLFAGLTLYSLLGNLRKDSRFRRIPRSEWLNLDGLNQKNLTDVYQYYDAQTDDNLLTRAVAKSARALGATIMENSCFLNAEQHSNDDISIEFQYASDPTPTRIITSLVINAGGPWVDKIQTALSYARKGPNIVLVQGAHIELDKPLSEGIFYVEAPSDRRAVFIMPWRGGSMVGTTEKQHNGDPGSPVASDEEISYLCNTLKHYFPDYKGVVTHQWAGLRVLPQANKTSSSALRPFSSQARDTVIHLDNEIQPRSISLYGGKLTAYRITAENVAQLAMRTLGKARKNLQTNAIELKTP